MKKYIAFLLILLILLVLQIVLIACGSSVSTDDTNNNDNKNNGETDDTAGIPSEAETPRYTPDVPDMTFRGDKFRVLGIDPEAFKDYLLDFDFETENGDILNDAIYRRNRYIEEKYDMKFESAYIQGNDYNATHTSMRRFVLAGSDDYEMVMLLTRNAFSSAIEQHLTPLDRIPYIDLSQPWYHSAVNERFSMGGKKFLAYSDECLNMYGFTTSMLFNKSLAGDLGLENFYNLVKNGKWTWDKFYETAVSAIRDLDGDGVYTSNDIAGIIGEEDTFFPPIWMGSGLVLVEKDAGDIPLFSAPSNERLLETFEKTINWIQTDGFFINSFLEFGYDEASRAKGSSLFSSGHSLFKIGRITDVLVLRGMDADFGILPLPKYDEFQENYVSRMEDAWIHVVPATNSKPEMTGIMMESLAAESKNEVIPAFFEIALKTKYARDEESEEMLDILFGNVTADIGDIIWYSTVRGPICAQILSKRSGFASTLERMSNQVERLISQAVGIE